MSKSYDELRYLKIKGKEHIVRVIAVGNKKLVHCYETLVKIGGMQSDRYKNVYALLKPVAVLSPYEAGAYFAEPGKMADFIVDNKILKHDDPLLPALYDLASDFDNEATQPERPKHVELVHSVPASSALTIVPAAQNITGIQICDITIRQDAESRYCLNDLHKAAGGEARHAPALWLRSDQAIELIKVISSYTDSYTINPVNKVVGKGKVQGTFVVKKLVYAYAAWVSAEFYDAVLTTYDAVVTGKLQPTHPQLPQNYTEALEHLLLAVKQKDQLLIENKIKEEVIAQKEEIIEVQKPKVEFYDTVTQSDSTVSMKAVADMLDSNVGGRTKLMAFLRKKGVLTRTNLPYHNHVESGCFKVVETMTAGGLKTYTVVTQKGVDYIRKQLLKAGYTQNQPALKRAA